MLEGDGMAGFDEDRDDWGAEPITIGPYRVIRRLGAGGMGEVYLARSPGGRPVAVKTVGAGASMTEADRRRFAREVSLAGRIGAAHTAVVIDSAPDADPPWMATQYVPAPSLAELVGTCGPLPVAGARWVAAGTAEALAVLHDEGIVHRDLKPSNVLLPSDGPRLIDFGISHPAELTLTTVTLGTIAFASPEQARGERSTRASDVYAWGAMVFHLAVGRPPYAPGEPFQLLARVSRAEHDLAGLPTELQEVVLSCLRAEPQERPTAAELVEALRVDLDERPGSTGADGWLPSSWLGLIRERETADDTGRRSAGTRSAGTRSAASRDRTVGDGTTVRNGPVRNRSGSPLGAPVPGRPRTARRPAARATPVRRPVGPRAGRPAWWRAVLAATAVIVLSAGALLLPQLLRGDQKDDTAAGGVPNNVTYRDLDTEAAPAPVPSPSPSVPKGHSEAVAFMDSVTAGDCLNLRYTTSTYAPEGLPKRVPCGAAAAATRVSRVIMLDKDTWRPLQKCPEGADTSEWSPDDLDLKLDLRELCIGRIFRTGDCFPARDWVGGRHDEGLAVSLGRGRTGRTFAKWDCDWGISNLFEYLVKVTSVHASSAGRGVCGERDAWLVEQNKKLICTRVVSS